MSIHDKLIVSVVVVITVLIARLSVIFFPEREVRIFGLVIHHFWYGIIFLVLVFFLPREMKYLILGIGIGLLLDELIFIIYGGKNDIDYWAPISSIGTIVLLGVFELIIWMI